jgi:putrescine transport system ATP-binding protein
MSDDPEFIRIEGLSKSFGNFVAVDNVCLEVARGELFAILGGSGCGKTTLLRMLAGFETPSAGRVIIDGVDITTLPPYERPVNMMFQSYAVFPHMSVERNVAYGLKKEGTPKSQLAGRVAEMLKLVQLEELSSRKPHQLSGGQQQRVALARALIKRPKVLLLDEPLAALDRKLREQTQFELMDIQDRLGITFVVVTHDQEEAMTLADHIAVMDKGRFVQIGTPSQIYEYPRNRFVADFFGTINIFEGEVERHDPQHLDIRSSEAGGTIKALPVEGVSLDAPIWVAVRPEKISISKTPPNEDDRTVLKGTVEDLAYLGNISIYRVATDTGKVIQVSAQNQHRSAELVLEWDDEVYLSWARGGSVVLHE